MSLGLFYEINISIHVKALDLSYILNSAFLNYYYFRVFLLYLTNTFLHEGL